MPKKRAGDRTKTEQADRETVRPTRKQRRAAEVLVENGGKSVSAAMREAGYSEATAKTPQKLTESDGWQKLMEEMLPDKDLAAVHQGMLKATRIDHMVFPLSVSDEEMAELLSSVNCTLQKVVHGEQANHCYFWSPDNVSRGKALELAYKLKGRLEKRGEGSPGDIRLVILANFGLSNRGEGIVDVPAVAGALPDPS